MATDTRVTAGARPGAAGAATTGSGAQPDAVAPPKKKKLVVVGVVVVLALAAAAYFLLLAPKGEAHAAEEEHPPVELGEVMTVDPVSLNLANGRYLRLGIALQLTAEVHGEVSSAQALDAAIALFSGRDIAEVTDPAVREQLTTELAHQLTETYHGDVVDVYLTEYVTQ